jgi:hypothetical protein
MTVSILRSAEGWVHRPRAAPSHRRRHRRAVAQPCGHRGCRPQHRHRASRQPDATVTDHDAVPGGGPGHQLRSHVNDVGRDPAKHR